MSRSKCQKNVTLIFREHDRAVPEMSEFTEHRKVGACQEKLAPPRSLSDAGEDAEMIWNVIVERYPKAAPLLCEMEAAIQRAENLVHKFRTSVDINVGDIERPSLTHISNSDASSTMLTAHSGTQWSTSDENYDVEEVGTRMSDDSILKNEDTSSSSSSSDDPVDRQDYDELINTGVLKDPTIKQNLRKNEDYYSINSTNQRADSLGRQKPVSDVSPDRCGNPEARKKSSPKKIQSTKVVDLCTNEPSNTLEDIISSSSKVTTGENQSTSMKNPKTENTLGLIEQAKNSTTDSSPVRNSLQIETENENIHSEKENDNGNGWKNPYKKTAVKILEQYAEQCNEKLEFKVIRNKSNSCEIECSFASRTAKSVGHPESSVQNEVAVLILRMLAEEQMDDEKDMKNLIPFSYKQMKDIDSLGISQPENAMRKLYKLCLEKNAPKPIYALHVDYVPEGVKNVAVCTALNKSATGVGIREKVAKISAAENLYTQLLLEQSS